MDADGLPLVGPGIDYTKVEAINQKRTIAFINHFITHTSHFLNRFSCVCEEKLETLHGRIKELEVSLSLLEAKLSSIPGLESVTAPTSSATSAPAAPASSTPAAASYPAAPAAPPPPAGPIAPATATSEAAAVAEEAAPQQEAAAANPVSKDPRYVKFFKMVQFGVPPQAIKGKMVMEGLNPDYLETPDAPAPADNGPKASANDDDDDDDDSDKEESDSDSDASFSD